MKKMIECRIPIFSIILLQRIPLQLEWELIFLEQLRFIVEIMFEFLQL